MLAAIAILSVAAAPTRGQAKDAFAACETEAGLAVLASPIAPWKGAPLKVVFTAEKPLKGELSLVAPDGKVAVTSSERHGGPPYFWFAEVASPESGDWVATLTREGRGSRVRDGQAYVLSYQDRRGAAASDSLRAFGRSEAPGIAKPRTSIPRGSRSSSTIRSKLRRRGRRLHEVLRDKSRNMLFDHLGLGEDSKKLVMQPDCADLPYFLRAYFAFQGRLAVRLFKCSRGGGGKAPRCPQWFNIQKEDVSQSASKQQPTQSASNSLFGVFETAAAQQSAPQSSSRPQGLVPGFGYYIRTVVANAVHSGSGRTAADDNNTDYYPVPLTAETLRPGTIYADPYGHVLVLVKRVAQTSDAAGVFLAVDGQPDGTVARKRFWRGNFLFAQNPSLGSPGFKRFRPIVADNSGALRRLTNAEIAKDPDYGDFSLEQSSSASKTSMIAWTTSCRPIHSILSGR